MYKFHLNEQTNDMLLLHPHQNVIAAAAKPVND